MSLFYKRHPVALLYVGLVGLFRTAAEGHALLMLLTHPDMTGGEAFSSFICSHLMTPAMNAALAILQVIPKVTPDVNLRGASMVCSVQQISGRLNASSLTSEQPAGSIRVESN